MSSSVPEEFLQLFARGIFAGVTFGFGQKCPPRKVKILAEISRLLFKDRFGAEVAALVRGARIVIGAIEADAQVGVAAVTGVAATGEAGQCPFPAAFVTMTSVAHLLHFSHFWGLRQNEFS